MPAFDMPAEELGAVAAWVHTRNEGMLAPEVVPAKRVSWPDPLPGDWPTYNGKFSGNRYSELKQINAANVASLKPKWVFPIPHYALEVTPLVANGVMYVTGPNQVYALDALTGREIWHYSRPTTPNIVHDAALGTNRGVAVRGDRVFFVTDNIHLLALDRSTGALIWDRLMAPKIDGFENYGGTMAPLVVRDMVLVGVAGADAGMRGFLAAFQADTGELLWRRWTIPLGDEKGAETWKGASGMRGGGSTWLTGSYDPATDTLYWPIGNPWPDSEGDERPGDNLYTDCVLAIDAKTGEIKWHYQFTPHDIADRDSTEPMVLVDTVYRGGQRKLILHADRNGFFYVLDRTNGNVLLAKPFLRRVDWASEIGKDGRPVVVDPAGCPVDAANWSSATWSPQTHLYYFLALEECTGNPVGYPDQTGRRYLRALDIETGRIAWEVSQPGPAKAKTWSGVLVTAGGLVFYGKPNGGFEAVSDRDGKELWRFETNIRMKASPMTFEIGGRQYVAIAAGPNILCFGL
jgi:PQQ-dependent dehydrogenase (methanol/ethanol family)